MCWDSERSNRCSMRACGIHVHRFPEYENSGYPKPAIDEGESGEKNGASCPTTMDVRAHSKLTVPVRGPIRPAAAPSGAVGNPPKKPSRRSPLALAPPKAGP